MLQQVLGQAGAEAEPCRSRGWVRLERRLSHAAAGAESGWSGG